MNAHTQHQKSYGKKVVNKGSHLERKQTQVMFKTEQSSALAGTELGMLMRTIRACLDHVCLNRVNCMPI